MKKNIFLLFLIFCSCLIFANEMVIEKTNGDIINIPLENIDYISFDTSDISENLENLVSWMTGYFSSHNQSQSDSNFLDIRLKMGRIWNDNEDGYWVYVEQAVAGYAPYRQRIYHVFLDGSQLRDEIFTIPNEDNYVGGCQNPSLFDNLDPDMLIIKDGCDVFFSWDGEKFYGTTEGVGCISTTNGASYATTELELTNTYMSSWDQGWNSNGVQVWGSTVGPYMFDKLQDYPIK